MDLAQLLKQLPSGDFTLAVRPAEIGKASGMAYCHEGTHGLEPSACELESTAAANGTSDPKHCQPAVKHHACNILGPQPLFAAACSHNVATVSVHADNYTGKNFLSDLHLWHGEDADGQALTSTFAAVTLEPVAGLPADLLLAVAHGNKQPRQPAASHKLTLCAVAAALLPDEGEDFVHHHGPVQMTRSIPGPQDNVPHSCCETLHGCACVQDTDGEALPAGPQQEKVLV